MLGVGFARCVVVAKREPLDVFVEVGGAHLERRAEVGSHRSLAALFHEAQALRAPRRRPRLVVVDVNLEQHRRHLLRSEEFAVPSADVVPADHPHERGVASEVSDALRDVGGGPARAVRGLDALRRDVLAEGPRRGLERARAGYPLLAARGEERLDVLVGVHGHASAGFGDAARIEDAGREARVVQTHQDVAHGVPEADEEHLARVDGIVGRHGRRSEGDGRGGGLVGGRGEGAAGGTAT